MGEHTIDVKPVDGANSSPPASDSPSKDAPKKSKDDEEALDKAKLANFWRILSYSTTLDWFLMGAATICSVGAGVTLPLMNIVFGNLVGNFNGYFIPGSTVTKDQFLDSVNKNALYIVYLFIGKFFLAYVSMFSFRITGIRISAALRLAYIRALFVQPISVFDKLPSGKPTSMITSSSNTIQIGISEKLSILVQFTALIVAAYVVAFRYSWALTLVSSSALLFIGLVYGVQVPFIFKKMRQIEHSNEKASSIAGESFGSIRTIVACGAEERIASRYAEWIAKSKTVGLKMSFLTGAQFSPAFFASYCNFALTFWYGIQLFNGNHIASAGTVVTVFFSVLLVVSAVGNIVMPMIGITKAASASTGFFTMIDTPVPETQGYKEPEASAHEDIRFQDVTFSYPSRPDVTVLRNLSVLFPTGQVTAIVGPSGSGKSTIVGLLERWYHIAEATSGRDGLQMSKDEKDVKDTSKGNDESDVRVAEPNSGTIMIGNREVSSLDLKWWRSQIGLVQQEPFTFNATIYTNVSYGLVGSKWEHEDEAAKLELVKKACKEAFADEFIDRLPKGYQTLVGDNGIQLSGGQRQRLAIARSIIKQPPILILDEATSAIDVRSEIIVQQALDRVSKNRTTISIAHRLSTVKKAHKIVVLKNGAIVEEGTHQTLLENQDGVYYGLVHAQQLDMDERHQQSPTVDDELEAERVPSMKDNKSIKSGHTDHSEFVEEVYKPQGLIRTVGLLLYEQKTHWRLYLSTVLAAAGCGGMSSSLPEFKHISSICRAGQPAFAIQSFLFAKIVAVFQYTGQQLLDGANFWALMFFMEAIAVGICYFVLGFASNSISVYISTTYRQQYYENILQKPMRFYDAKENSAGTLTARLSTDPTQLQELLGTHMALPLVAMFNISGSVAISFAFGWKLTLVTMFSALPLIFLAGFMRIRYELQFEKLNAAVFAESSQFASEAIGAFRTVTSLTLEDTITNRYSLLLRGHVKDAWIKARLSTFIFATSDTIDLLCMALCFWYGGRLLSTHEYNVVQFFVIYVAIVQGGQAAGQWCSFAPNMAQATAAANRILSLRTSAKSKGVDSSAVISDTEGGVKIEFKDVYFRYPSRDVPVFKGLNLTIEKGQFAALVGPSGCGKTSIVSLLERFYDIQSGTILLNNTPISTLNINAYRKHIALVSQEPTLFQGTIRDNLLLGVDSSTITDEDIHAACRAAEIHDFVVSLPEGYSTDPGLKATALSVGQTQRLTLARALLRSPHLLLLDEATSSLDSTSEKLVQAALERAAKGRTMLVVAHRLATVQRADIIFVMGEGGQVVEVGTHRALVAKGGVYAGMCQSQALDR